MMLQLRCLAFVSLLGCCFAATHWQAVARDDLVMMTNENPEISNSDLMFALHASLSAQFPDLVFLVHVADNSSSLAALWSSTTEEDSQTSSNGMWWDVSSKSLFVYASTSPACGQYSNLRTGAAWVLTGAAAAAADWTSGSINSSSSLAVAANYTLENGPSVGLTLSMVLVTEGSLVVHSFNARCLYRRSLPRMAGGWQLSTIVGSSQDDCSSP